VLLDGGGLRIHHSGSYQRKPATPVNNLQLSPSNRLVAGESQAYIHADEATTGWAAMVGQGESKQKTGRKSKNLLGITFYRPLSPSAIHRDYFLELVTQCGYSAHLPRFTAITF
jgi:hypothetical protein